MSYSTPSVETFVARFPAFTETDDDVVADALSDAALHISDDWEEKDYQKALMLLAAHNLTMDGQGTSAEAKMFKQGLRNFQSFGSGSLSFSRESVKDGYQATSYGQRFFDILSRNYAGIAVAEGS